MKILFWAFHTEPSRDYVYIYDGDSTRDDILARSGSVIPRPFITSGNNALIIFDSNAAVSGNGFFVRLTAGKYVNSYLLP